MKDWENEGSYSYGSVHTVDKVLLYVSSCLMNSKYVFLWDVGIHKVYELPTAFSLQYVSYGHTMR